MTDTLVSLAAIAVVAVIAPIVAQGMPRITLPVVVMEIVLGILIGPQILNLVHDDLAISSLSAMGLSFLFFLAGFELDFEKIRGRPLQLGALSWLISLMLGFTLAGWLQAAGLIRSVLYVGLAVSTTSLGTLMPLLRDRGDLESPFGTYVVGAGSLAEFGPIVLIALVLHPVASRYSPAVLLNLFLLVVVVLAFVARRWRPPLVTHLVRQTMRSSAQLAVRLSLALLTGLVFVAAVFDLDYLLGAFAAGVIASQVVHTLHASEADAIEELRMKYEGIGFGFIIPIFFVVSGIRFDVRALLDDGRSLALVPVFLALFLIVRGTPALLLYRMDLEDHERLSLAVLCATQLPIVIAVATLGVSNGRMTPDVASALIGAGVLSVFCYPLLALALRTRAQIA